MTDKWTPEQEQRTKKTLERLAKAIGPHDYSDFAAALVEITRLRTELGEALDDALKRDEDEKDEAIALQGRLNTIYRSAAAEGLVLGDDPDYDVCRSFRNARRAEAAEIAQAALVKALEECIRSERRSADRC